MTMRNVQLWTPSGEICYPGESHVKQYPWENVGALTVAEAAVSSAEKLQANMEVTFVAAGKSCIYTPDDGQAAVDFRVRTDGDEDDSNVLDMFWAAKDIGDRIYSRMSRLTCLQGTQIYSTGIYFNDSIVQSLNSWISTITPVQPSTADNNISQYPVNCHGIKKFGFVLTTLDASTTTVYIDARRF